MVSSSRRAVGLVALFLIAWTPAAQAAHEGEKDPRNWPTVQRFVADRYELAGQVLTLRVHARQSDYFNCAYRHAHSELMSFTLMGGPLETVTGYMPRDLGRLLAKELEKDPWLPVTVKVRFDPKRLSEACPDQVDVLMWAMGWQYPAGSLSPGRPDTSRHPTRAILAEAGQDDLWRVFNGRKAKRRYDRAGQPIVVPTEAALLGKIVELTAGARLSRSYHCAFRGGTRTHYALRLHNGAAQFVHAYVPRNAEARKLMDVIALHRDVLIKVEGRVVKQIPSNYCMPQIEVSSWSFPELPVDE